jgi:hypothetical protein
MNFTESQTLHEPLGEHLSVKYFYKDLKLQNSKVSSQTIAMKKGGKETQLAQCKVRLFCKH